jgi:hypothetical protein
MNLQGWLQLLENKQTRWMTSVNRELQGPALIASLQ